MRRPVAMILVALLSPTALAAPVEGELAFLAEGSIAGAGVLRAHGSVLDLSPAVRDGSAFALAWDAADGARHVQNGTDTAGFTSEDEPWPARVSTQAARLEGFACASSPCEILVWTGSDASIVLEGSFAGVLRPDPRPAATSVSASFGPARGLELTTAREGVALSAGDGAPLAAEGVLASTGPTFVYLYGASADLVAGGAARRVETGLTRSPVVGGLHDQTTDAYLLLEVTGLRVEGAAPFRLDASSAMLELSGDVASDRAQGWIAAEGARHDVTLSSVEVGGDLVVAVSPDRSGRIVVATMQGDAHRIAIGGRPVVEAPAEARVAPVVAIVGGLALAATLGTAARALAIALYTRVAPADVLSNRSREALHAYIRAHPGAHVSEMSRALGVGRVVLQHHLRMLEMHRFVVSRSAGRILAYYPPDRVPGEADLSAQATLKDETRRAVARALLAAEAPLSQKDLVERTGLPQRLVSYHLQRLEKAGLVVGEGQRPRLFAGKATLGMLEAQAVGA